MTSLQIAEITGKQHAHVMRDIRNMVETINKTNESTSGLVGSEYHRGNRTQYKFLSEQSQNVILNFAFGDNSSQYQIEATSYMDAKGERRAMYLLNKKACLLLASGYDVALRAKIIDRWEELELAARPQIPQTYSQALMLAARQAEQIEQQQKLLAVQSQTIVDLNEANAEMRIKVSYYDQILASKSTVTTTQIAQDYGMSAKKFNVLLRNMKIQRKVGGQWILYAPHNTMGYVHSDTFIPEKSTTGKVVMTTKWTQKGRIFLYNELKNQGVLPLIEQNFK